MSLRDKVSPLFRIIVGILLVALALYSLSRVAEAGTSDLKSDYDGPVLDVPLFTPDDKGGYNMAVIKLPDGRPLLLPYMCVRQARAQAIECMIVEMNTGKAYVKKLYLNSLET